MDQLDLIRERISIVDFIGESLQLKRAGRNFKALCPFHNERTPSLVVSPERQIWHCFGCFPPGELIKTPFGLHAIESIDQNHWVISGSGRLKKVVTKMSRDYTGKLITIRLRKLGYEVRLTDDHQVYVIKGAPYTQKHYKNFSRRYHKYLKLKQNDPEVYQNKISKYFPIQKLPAGNLKPGDLLLYPLRRMETDITHIDISDYLTKNTRLGPRPRVLPLQTSVNDMFLKLIGYYIAEGSNHRAYIRFSLGDHETDLAEEIINLIIKTFGLQAKIHQRTESAKTGIEVTVCHSQLANIFENLCGKGAENKHIPFIFQELPTTKQRVLLEAIFRGDGTSFTANKSHHIHKSITTISKILAEQLVDILLRLNYFPTLHIQKPKVDKLQVNHKQAYTVYWSEQANQKYNAVYYLKDGSQYWILPIASLMQENYQGPVYNLNVSDDHSYTTPSFAVANCGKGGDIFTFLMELEHLEFPEALHILAERAGVQLESRPAQSAAAKLKENLLAIHHLSEEYYHYILTKHVLGERARRYLKERGITDALINTFSLGFSPRSWDNLARFLQKKGYRQPDLELAGLVVKGRTGVYDRFRDRIMFPLKDHRGSTIAFAGRVLDPEIKEAKYINSPETPLYTKGNTFYGLNVTKDAIRSSGSAVVVEGEFDVISSFAAGVTNVVAIKGSAITEAQVRLIKRFAERVILALDRDSAGDAAARRGIEIADRAGLDMRVVAIPMGKDPDEAARENPQLWKQAIGKAVPYFDFLIDSAFTRLEGKEAFSKRKISAELLPILARIDNSIVQAHYVKILADRLAVPEETVSEVLMQTKVPLIQANTAVETTPQTKGHTELLEEHLLSLILQAPDMKSALSQLAEKIDPSELVDPVVKRIFCALLDFAAEQKTVEIRVFAKILPEELVATLDRLYLSNLSAFTEPEVWQREFGASILLVRRMMLRRKIKTFTTEITVAEGKGDTTLLEKLHEQLKEVTAALKSSS